MSSPSLEDPSDLHMQITKSLFNFFKSVSVTCRFVVNRKLAISQFQGFLFCFCVKTWLFLINDMVQNVLSSS